MLVLGTLAMLLVHAVPLPHVITTRNWRVLHPSEYGY